MYMIVKDRSYTKKSQNIIGYLYCVMYTTSWLSNLNNYSFHMSYEHTWKLLSCVPYHVRCQSNPLELFTYMCISLTQKYTQNVHFCNIFIYLIHPNRPKKLHLCIHYDVCYINVQFYMLNIYTYDSLLC